MKKIAWLVSWMAVLDAAVCAHAQTGCVDSPEDPTILLALLGGIGVVWASIWVRRNVGKE